MWETEANNESFSGHIVALAIEKEDWDCHCVGHWNVVSRHGDTSGSCSLALASADEIDRATACGIARMSLFVEILGPSRELPHSSQYVFWITMFTI